MEDKLKELLKRLKMNESWLSMLLGLITVVIVAGLAINYWKDNKPKLSWFGHLDKEVQEQKKQKPSEETENNQAEKKEKYYVVKRGEGLWQIAQKVYGSGYNWVDIAKANKLKNPGVLYTGQKLKLPKVEKKVVAKKQAPKTAIKADKTIKGDSYTVQKGDNLWQIAVRAYQDGYQWVKIAKANKLKNPNVIEAGQKLTIPR